MPVLYPLPRIIVTDEVSSDSWDFTNVRQHLVHSDSAIGGPEEATWELQKGRVPNANELPPPGSKVELFDDNPQPYWVGRIEYPEVSPFMVTDDAYSGAYKYLARGMSSHLDDDRYDVSGVYPGGQDTQLVMSGVTSVLCPDIDAFTPLAQSTFRILREDSDSVLGLSAQEIVSSLATLGTFSGEQVLWAVRPYAGNVALEIRPRPTVVRYAVDLSQLTQAPFSWPLQIIFNKIILRWARGVTIVTDSASIAELGFTRTKFIDAADRIDSEETAQWVANVTLTRLSNIRPVGSGITIPWPLEITESGVPVPLWRVQAGYVIEVTGYITGSSKLVTAPVFIRSCTWDDDARTLTIQSEERFSELNLVPFLLKKQETTDRGGGETGTHTPDPTNPDAGTVVSPNAAKLDIGIKGSPDPKVAKPQPKDTFIPVLEPKDTIADPYLPADIATVNYVITSDWENDDFMDLAPIQGQLYGWQSTGDSGISYTVSNTGLGNFLTGTGGSDGALLTVGTPPDDEGPQISLGDWMRLTLNTKFATAGKQCTVAILIRRHSKKYEIPPEEMP